MSKTKLETKSKQIHVHLPPTLKSAVQKKSIATGISIAFKVREALENWVRKDIQTA